MPDSIQTETKIAGTPWRVRYTEVNGRRYGLRDVAVGREDDQLRCDGSGGARWYSESVCTFPGSIYDEDHAHLVAAAPDLLDALRDAYTHISQPRRMSQTEAVYAVNNYNKLTAKIRAAIAKAEAR